MIGPDVLVLGIDAASPDLIERWCDDGRLPHLAALRAAGRTARTAGLDGFFVGSTWPSLYTGTTPATHGVHYLIQLVPGTYRYHRPADEAFVQAEPFWRPLSRAGRRVAVLDVPLSRIDRSINGLHVVEWGGHDAIFGFRATPRSIGRAIRSRVGRHPLGGSCDASRSTADDYHRLVDALVRGIDLRRQLTEWVLGRERWNLVMQVFTESHCAGHQMWHLHDTSHPAHDPILAASLGDPLERVYRAIDTAIGSLVARAPNAIVLVVVGHGMSHWYGAQFLLAQTLARLGVSTPAPSDQAATHSAARAVWHRLPASIRAVATGAHRRVTPGWRRLRGPPSLPSPGIEPATSQCFVVPNGLAVGGIRINLAGREPGGIVEPGAGEHALVARVTEALLAIEDCRTGGPLVRRVLRTRDLFSGPRVDALPDLLVEWNDAVPTGSRALAGGAASRVRIQSRDIGVVEGENDFGRSGEHRSGGLLIAGGPGLAPARVEEAVPLIDVAPTIAAWLGVTLPAAEGRPHPAFRASPPTG